MGKEKANRRIKVCAGKAQPAGAAGALLPRAVQAGAAIPQPCPAQQTTARGTFAEKAASSPRVYCFFLPLSICEGTVLGTRSPHAACVERRWGLRSAARVGFSAPSSD